MIELTVRTLDSQNHPFTVEDDITVAQFKETIAGTVNIPAETQRIIYCGRVLNDETKLSEYDVNGKVVHLVQRAPPSETQNNDGAGGARTHSPQRQRVLGGNAMYLGSMAIPLEPQNLIPPPPTHSLAASRLNVARRMLRRAAYVIGVLENPSGRGATTTPPEEPQEETTPVFEARVIVSTSSTELVDEAHVLNEIQNTIMNAGGTGAGIPSTAAAAIPTAATNTTTTEEPPPPPENPISTPSDVSTEETSNVAGTSQGCNETDTPVASSTPEGVSPMSTSNEDLTDEGRTGNQNANTNTLAENASRTSEMAELLDTLARLQARFAPFLERYQTFMRDDPVVGTEEVRRTQAMMNRVSEVLHFLGHAYHSLSDIIIRVRNPPSRPLLCRPILIQHSAVLQAGFPIQVEAQINFNPDNGPAATSTPPTPTANASTPTNAPPASQNPDWASVPLAGPQVTNVRPMWNYIQDMGGLGPTGFQLQSFPFGLRNMSRGGGANRTGQPAGGNAPSGQANANANTNGNAENASNNPDVEIFMEVTPESITIDSLETTLLGGNQAEGLRGAPPPELLQSIMQMASHFVNRGATRVNINPQPTNVNAQPTNAPAASTTTTTATNQNETQNGANSGQNSQARGNTQTNPTTATHTRSTARPHVHLAQHAMQGFDPFLPCNSHHVTHRRRGQLRGVATTAATLATSNVSATRRQSAPATGGSMPGIPVSNVMQDIRNSLQHLYARQQQPQPGGGGSTPATASQTPPSEPANDWSRLTSIIPNFGSIFPHLRSVNGNGITIYQLHQLIGDPPEGGDGIFSDFFIFLTRNFTFADIMQLNSGRLDALMRIRTELRNFVLERVLDGNPTSGNVGRGVNRLIEELQPFLQNLSHLQVRDDIDIIRSTLLLLRTRLPYIINLAVSRTPNSIKMLVEQCKILGRHFCALVLHASSNGQRGIEDVLQRIIQTLFQTRYLEGFTPDVQQWMLITVRTRLNHHLRSLNVPPSVLQAYIVRNVDSVTNNTVQPMDVDVEMTGSEETGEAGGSTNVLGMLNTTAADQLPRVLLGSESWHGQVPSDWVPLITRDSQRQRKQNQQTPLSDAYLGGMPSKRRKIIASAKPQGSLPQVISESIRRAVTATGLSNVGDLETVAQDAGTDLALQAAYRDLLRTRVQSTVQDNTDFTPDRFPNASNYFNKSQ